MDRSFRRATAPLLGILLAARWAAAGPDPWIATWSTSPEPADHGSRDPLLAIENQTVRERVRVSIGGPRIRLRLSNEYGSAPLLVGSVTVAEPQEAPTVRPGTIRTVTFDERSAFVIPAGAPVVSDPVDFPVAPGSEIAISVFFPKRVATPTLHALALKRAVVSKAGDQTHEERIDTAAVSESSILVSTVLVPARPSQVLVVAFGDSLTDGDGSTVDADRNWSHDLVRRLARRSTGPAVAVVNEGIVGNRLLGDGFGISASFGVNALARFDRDALAVPGVTHVVLLEGINDIGFPGASARGRILVDPADAPAPEDLIAAYRQLIARAHARGVQAIGATITPCEGFTITNYYSEAKEAARQAVNRWIRTSGAFDGVIDFDAVLRDPNHPSRVLPTLASKDHLHPNDAGYEAMANTVDVGLFSASADAVDPSGKDEKKK